MPRLSLHSRNKPCMMRWPKHQNKPDFFQKSSAGGMHRFKACQVSLLKAARPTGSSVLSQNKSNLLKLTTNTGGKSRYGISSSTSRKKKSQAEQKQQERAFKRTVSILGKKFEIHRVWFFFYCVVMLCYKHSFPRRLKHCTSKHSCQQLTEQIFSRAVSHYWLHIFTLEAISCIQDRLHLCIKAKTQGCHKL